MPTDLTFEQLYQLVNEASQSDRFYALQLFFVVFIGCTVEESCELVWEDLFIEDRGDATGQGEVSNEQ